jgi:hypothetical protein
MEEYAREKELGSEHGTVQRVADQLGYGVETVRKGSSAPTSTSA